MLFLLRQLARLPLRYLHAIGAFLGWCVYALSPGYRRRLRRNASRAGIAEASWRQSVAEAGKMVLESLRLWFRPPEQPLADPVRWHGEQVIEEALALGRGLVFLTPHLGSFEVTAQAYAQRYGARRPITVLFRPARYRMLRDLQQEARARPALGTAPATLGGVRQMMRALKRGEAVGLLPDQVPPQGMGVWAPFFGRPAYTMTLAARLAQQSGAPIVLAWCERLPRGAGFDLRLSLLTEPLPLRGADAQALQQAQAAVINRAMEALILQCPQQYLWGYNRYKGPRSVRAGPEDDE
jgi:Kdo2-lipid IVA lauroyltransferase/acyltransferase